MLNLNEEVKQALRLEKIRFIEWERRLESYQTQLKENKLNEEFKKLFESEEEAWYHIKQDEKRAKAVVDWFRNYWANQKSYLKMLFYHPIIEKEIGDEEYFKNLEFPYNQSNYTFEIIMLALGLIFLFL